MGHGFFHFMGYNRGKPTPYRRRSYALADGSVEEISMKLVGTSGCCAVYLCHESGNDSETLLGCKRSSLLLACSDDLRIQDVGSSGDLEGLEQPSLPDFPLFC